MSAPRSDFMAPSLFLSIDVCRGLGISPLRINIWLGISQADLGPRSAQELLFSGFLRSLKKKISKICAHSERYSNILAGMFEVRFFLATPRFHCHRSKPWKFFFIYFAPGPPRLKLVPKTEQKQKEPPKNRLATHQNNEDISGKYKTEKKERKTKAQQDHVRSSRSSLQYE